MDAIFQIAPLPISCPSPAHAEALQAARMLAAAIIAGLGGVGYYGFRWWTEGRFIVSTDDAYVRADLSVIAAKASGYVTGVQVTDNTQVAKGALLAKIDDRDYVIALDAAKNKLATQDATIARLREQAKAQVSSAKAAQFRTQADFERAQTLASQEFGSRKYRCAVRGRCRQSGCSGRAICPAGDTALGARSDG